ncbi:sigma-E processing peptidase SpoIIGA [Mesobacillus foraminis]|uniref:sigma-E processing peptidase SpoIIGA n=1 Tax=Mesobacillus foraminis TaxID=279826 RepID=UPI001BEA7E07|nr:sigma-E processing peptidase SpoIIGA [Mesobacillus foraminis]MBT2756098.1 sigma-E processing peptidase SpoIIGA [Mesobacillus foraminis]
MVVYLDIIWALNLFFDALLLYLTSLILKRGVKHWRVFLGGLIGSLLILLTLTPFEHTGHPVVKLIFSVMMVLSVFGYRRFPFFLKSLMTFYLVTFLIGGALTGVHYFIRFDMDLTSSFAVANIHGFGDPVSWLFVLLGFPLAWHFSKQGIEQIDMVKIQYDQIVEVKIEIGELRLELKGLVDSGNQLYDPISRMPVMFVSLKSIQDIIPDPIRRIAENPDLILTGSETIPEDFESRMKIIPCRVVGQEHQLVVAMKPDILSINRKGNIHAVERALVSFTAQQLSADESFHCIVHPKMLAGISSEETGVRVS